MGLYSTNKVASVGMSAYSEAMRELEEATFDPDFGHILETSIQLYENDSRMFDALIECDFISAMNEAVLLEDEAKAANDAAEEKKKGKITEAIAKIFTSAIEGIKKAFATVAAKIKSLFSKDEKIVDKYKSVLTDENLSKFDGIPNFTAPSQISRADILQEISVISTGVSKFTDKVGKTKSKEEVSGSVDELKGLLKDSEERLNKSVEAAFAKKVDLYKVSKSDCTTWMANIKDSGKAIKELKETTAKTIAALKEMKAKFAKAAKDKKADQKSDETFIANAVYTCASESIKPLNKAFSASVSVIKKQIKSTRYGLIYTGAACAKIAKGQKPDATDKATTESTAWVVREACDTYVEECLGY